MAEGIRWTVRPLIGGESASAATLVEAEEMAGVFFGMYPDAVQTIGIWCNDSLVEIWYEGKCFVYAKGQQP